MRAKKDSLQVVETTDDTSTPEALAMKLRNMAERLQENRTAKRPNVTVQVDAPILLLLATTIETGQMTTVGSAIRVLLQQMAEAPDDYIRKDFLRSEIGRNQTLLRQRFLSIAIDAGHKLLDELGVENAELEADIKLMEYLREGQQR